MCHVTKQCLFPFSSVEANHDDWVKLKGKFLLNGTPARAVVYIEGPPPGIDVFVDHFDVKPAEKSPPARRPYIEVTHIKFLAFQHFTFSVCLMNHLISCFHVFFYRVMLLG